jgi:hypothetical protein
LFITLIGVYIGGTIAVAANSHRHYRPSPLQRLEPIISLSGAIAIAAKSLSGAIAAKSNTMHNHHFISANYRLNAAGDGKQ